jgi:hypothetical protein
MSTFDPSPQPHHQPYPLFNQQSMLNTPFHPQSLQSHSYSPAPSSLAMTNDNATGRNVHTDDAVQRQAPAHDPAGGFIAGGDPVGPHPFDPQLQPAPVVPHSLRSRSGTPSVPWRLQTRVAAQIQAPTPLPTHPQLAIGGGSNGISHIFNPANNAFLGAGGNASAVSTPSGSPWTRRYTTPFTTSPFYTSPATPSLYTPHSNTTLTPLIANFPAGQPSGGAAAAAGSANPSPSTPLRPGLVARQSHTYSPSPYSGPFARKRASAPPGLGMGPGLLLIQPHPLALHGAGPGFSPYRMHPAPPNFAWPPQELGKMPRFKPSKEQLAVLVESYDRNQ